MNSFKVWLQATAGSAKIRFNVAHQMFLAEERENIQIIIIMLMLFHVSRGEMFF